MRPIRLGQIDYLNCLPVFDAIEEREVLPGAELIKGPPTMINRMLMEGTIDAAPISSIEYARNAADCLILPDLSVSADGPVQSILLFSREPIAQLEGCPVSLTSSSATSVVLLQVLLRRFYGVRVELQVEKPDLEAMLDHAQAALLIGDDAMETAARRPDLIITDLGQVWKEWTGEVMVYALWVIRRETAEKEPELVTRLVDGLTEAKAWGRQATALPRMLAKARERVKISEEAIRSYFKTIDHDLGPRQIRGLQRYYSTAWEEGFLPENPPLQIWGEGKLPRRTALR